MLFASDLDQTLIYSYSLFGKDLRETVLPIEEVEGRQISFITETTLTRLKEIAARVLFVPVTTRTIQQYCRLQVFQAEIKPKYAVVSNGGNILVDGVTDPDWAMNIKQSLANKCLPREEIIQRFSEIGSNTWIRSERIADDFFYYCLVEKDLIPWDELNSFAAWASGNGWNTYVQGRKLYIIPSVVNKKDAVLHIKERENKRQIIASGDSLLDLCLLECADLAISPAHGEIYKYQHKQLGTSCKINFTRVSGIGCSDEILCYLSP